MFELITFAGYLRRTDPELYSIYLGDAWFMTGGHLRLLALCWSDKGGSAPELVQHKRAYRALLVIPVVALTVFVTAMEMYGKAA